MEKSDCSLRLNDTFGSYEELREALDRYEKAKRVQFWKRDVKRIETAEHSAPRVYQIAKKYPELEYYSIRFSCIHGGQAFRPKNKFGHEKRRSRGTWKQDCKAEIIVGLTKERNRLVINKLVEEHNHDIPSTEVYKQFPKQRRTKDRGKVGKRGLVKSGANTKLPKNVLLEDVVKMTSFSRSNNLKKVANVLVEKYHCVVDLQTGDQDRVQGFFFQDQQMRRWFELFPEVLLLNGTYKLQNIGCCIYVICIENSVGTSDVIGAAVLTVEDKASVEWMVERFKERNPEWEKTSIVVTDRLSSEYKIAARHFPAAKRLICLSHAFQTFRKEVTATKLNITQTESEQCFDFFAKLTEAESDEEYSRILEDMDDTVPYVAAHYFYKNWHDLRAEWVKGLGANTRDFINSKLDSPNSKLKTTIGSCKTFSRFVDKLFLLLYIKRNDVKYELSRMITKVAGGDDLNAADKAYQQHLTPYAFDKVKSLLDECEKYISESAKDETLVVSETSCTCDFFTVVKLPCGHLLAHRRSLNLDLFDEVLFAQRWTRTRAQTAIEVEAPMLDAEETSEKSCEEKIAKAQAVCLSLAELCGDVPDRDFEERMELLAALVEFWRNGDKVTIERAGDDAEVVKIDHDYAVDVTPNETERLTIEFVS